VYLVCCSCDITQMMVTWCYLMACVNFELVCIWIVPVINNNNFELVCMCCVCCSCDITQMMVTWCYLMAAFCVCFCVCVQALN